MRSKKVIIAISVLIILVLGVIGGVILVQQRQQLLQKASTPTGQATVSIKPVSGDYIVGESIPVEIYFNPSGLSMSAVAVRIYYEAGTGEYVPSTPEINSALLTTGNWTCPIHKIEQQGERTLIDISCLTTSLNGFTTTQDTLLAKFDLGITTAPNTNKLDLIFDPELSIITQKSDATDILLTPQSNASYNVFSEQIDATLPPTAEPTASPTSAPTTPPDGSSTAPNYLKTDLNQDGVVNSTDYTIMIGNLFKSVLTNTRSDINGDGKVNLLDYVSLFEDYGKSSE